MGDPEIPMKLTHCITFVLALSGLAFAGGADKGKIVVPEECGPFYISVFGGGSFFDQGESNTSPQFLPPGITLTDGYEFDNGWIFGGSFGVRTAKNFRFELELSHSQAPGDTFSFQAAAAGLGAIGLDGALRGDVEQTSLMVNVAKEFGQGRLHPYVGAGVGLAYVDADLVGAVGLGGVGLGGLLGGLPAIGVPAWGDDVVLAYQAMAGLGFDVTSCMEAFLEYRLTGHGDLEDYLRILPGDLDLGWAQHVILGVRYAF